MVPFDYRTEYPLLHAADAREAHFIREYLFSEGYITVERAPGEPQYTLTMKGWSRLEPGPVGIPASALSLCPSTRP
jgi:hypothetical protein